MNKCIFCGAELPLNARFCGHCGHIQDTVTATDEATSRSDQDEERRRAILQDLLFPGLPLSSEQLHVSDVPIVQGTPQVSGVPAVPGSPSSAGNLSPIEPFSQGPAPSLPSAFAQPQAPSPSYPASQGSFPQTGQQPPHLKHSPHHALVAAPKVASGSAVKWIVITITTLVVVGAGGTGLAAYLLTRPQPVINVTSEYKVGTTLAGSTGTVLHVSGQKFSGTSAITFLLDGRPVPGNQIVHSDANGNVRVDLVITSSWTLGSHTLTARDASNYTTQSGLAVVIVPQGQANTPGPLGAPPDDASFTLGTTEQGVITQLGKQFTQNETVVITGHPDPTGGTVCKSRDNGQPQVYTGVTVDTGIPYRETAIYSCAGTYKGGKLTFTETLTSDTVVFAPNGVSSTCVLNGPHIDEQLSGSNTGHTTFSGTVTYPLIPTTAYTCQHGDYFFYYAGQGTWTGQIKGS